MRWSKYKGVLVVILACSGAVWGVRAASPAPEVHGERYLMVGEPPQKCRVVAYWHTDDGAQAFDVQAVDSGEMITIVEPRGTPSPTGSGLLPRLRAQICHWGRQRTRPAGFPAPPPAAVSECQSCSSCQPCGSSSAYCQCGPTVTAPESMVQTPEPPGHARTATGPGYNPNGCGTAAPLTTMPAQVWTASPCDCPYPVLNQRLAAMAAAPETAPSVIVPGTGPKWPPAYDHTGDQAPTTRSQPVPGAVSPSPPPVAALPSTYPQVPAEPWPPVVKPSPKSPATASAPLPGLPSPTQPPAMPQVQVQSPPRVTQPPPAASGPLPGLPSPTQPPAPPRVLAQLAQDAFPGKPAAPALIGPTGTSPLPWVTKSPALDSKPLPAMTASTNPPAMWPSSVPATVQPGAMPSWTSAPPAASVQPVQPSPVTTTAPAPAAQTPSTVQPAATPAWTSAPPAATVPPARPGLVTTMPPAPAAQAVATVQPAVTPSWTSSPPAATVQPAVTPAWTSAPPAATVQPTVPAVTTGPALPVKQAAPAAQPAVTALPIAPIPATTKAVVAQAPAAATVPPAAVATTKAVVAQAPAAVRVPPAATVPSVAAKVVPAPQPVASAVTAQGPLQPQSTLPTGPSPSQTTPDALRKEWDKVAPPPPPAPLLPVTPPVFPTGAPMAAATTNPLANLPASRVETQKNTDPLLSYAPPPAAVALDHAPLPAAASVQPVAATVAAPVAAGNTCAPVAQAATLPPAVPGKTTPPAPAATPAAAAVAKAAPAAAPTVALDKIPGIQSVLAAQNGSDLKVRYIPYPIVTIPESERVPNPPAPKIPQPPPVMAYVNAFTAPDTEKLKAQQGPGPQGMMPAGYRPGMVPAGYPYPGAGAMAQGMMPAMYPPQNPGFPVTIPANYQGPMPPNPVGNMVMAHPQAPYPYYGQPYAAMPYANQAMERQGMPVAYQTASTAAANVPQMLGTLRTALYPSQREWSAMYLANVDWRRNPEVVHALLSAARDDPAPTVRMACVQCLARMDLSPDLVSGPLQALKSDSDMLVRQAAEQALARYATVQPAGQASVVQPVRADNP